MDSFVCGVCVHVLMCLCVVYVCVYASVHACLCFYKHVEARMFSLITFPPCDFIKSLTEPGVSSISLAGQHVPRILVSPPR